MPVDAMSAKFVLKPEDLSVVVASNLNADTLSDLGSALAGSLGLANPIGAVGSAALMLEHFGLPGQAARLHQAIEATTAAGVRTRDVGGTATTEDVTKALIAALDA